MIDRVHRRDHSQKNLRRANVARRFVAADMLFARLERESIGRPTFGIVGNSDKSARHVPFILIARRKIRCMRSAETERNAKALRISDCDIDAEFAGRF